MSRHFPDAYAEYKMRVRAVIPLCCSSAGLAG
jgi:hypothetical protein